MPHANEFVIEKEKQDLFQIEDNPFGQSLDANYDLNFDSSNEIEDNLNNKNKINWDQHNFN